MASFVGLSKGRTWYSQLCVRACVCVRVHTRGGIIMHFVNQVTFLPGSEGWVRNNRVNGQNVSSRRNSMCEDLEMEWWQEDSRNWRKRGRPIALRESARVLPWGWSSSSWRGVDTQSDVHWWNISPAAREEMGRRERQKQEKQWGHDCYPDKKGRWCVLGSLWAVDSTKCIWEIETADLSDWSDTTVKEKKEL